MRAYCDSRRLMCGLETVMFARRACDGGEEVGAEGNTRWLCVLCCSLLLQVEVQRGWSSNRPAGLTPPRTIGWVRWVWAPRRFASMGGCARSVLCTVVERLRSAQRPQLGGCGNSHRVARMQLVLWTTGMQRAMHQSPRYPEPSFG